MKTDWKRGDVAKYGGNWGYAVVEVLEPLEKHGSDKIRCRIIEVLSEGID